MHKQKRDIHTYFPGSSFTIFQLRARAEAVIGAGSSRHLELIAPEGVIIPSRSRAESDRAVRLAVGEER